MAHSSKPARYAMTALCYLAAAALPVASAGARDFTYAGWGGGLQDAQREAYLRPLEKVLGAPVKEDIYLGGWAKFDTMRTSKDIVWDVVNVESPELQRGCDEGMFVKLDYTNIGTAPEAFIPGGAAECGIGSYVWAFALAYNGATQPPPHGMADFWDIKTWPGQRGMRKGPHFNLELALLADGVAPADVYKTLSTPAGIDRAFRKLDAIKSHIIWWEAPAQSVDQLTSGNAVMVIAPNARVGAAAKSGHDLKMVFNPGMIGIDYWVIVKGTPDLGQSYEFLKLATKPERQAAFSTLFSYAPTVKSANAMLPANVVATLPVGEALAHALNVSSNEATQFWADHGDEVNERWNTWLAR